MAKTLDQKLLAAHDWNNPSAMIGDLYIDFIASKYSDHSTLQSASRLQAFAADSDELAPRYDQAYQEYGLVQDRVPLHYCPTGTQLPESIFPGKLLQTYLPYPQHFVMPMCSLKTHHFCRVQNF